MSHEENSFLESIETSPFEIVPRLIYADWLDEQSDPRGELLRVHCELTAISTNDPRFKELVEREKALLRFCEREWYETIAVGYEFEIEGVLPQRVGTAFDLPDGTILLSGWLRNGRAWSMQSVRVPLVDGSYHTHQRTLLERLDGFVDSWGCNDESVGGLYLQFARTAIYPENVVRGGICYAASSPYETGFRDDPPSPTVAANDGKWWKFWQ